MEVLREKSSWCFCSGGGKSERVKGGIFSTKGPAMASISGNGGGGDGRTGFLIHRNLLLTTHANIPSASFAVTSQVQIHHGRLAAKLVPQRFVFKTPPKYLFSLNFLLLHSSFPFKFKCDFEIWNSIEARNRNFNLLYRF